MSWSEIASLIAMLGAAGSFVAFLLKVGHDVGRIRGVIETTLPYLDAVQSEQDARITDVDRRLQRAERDNVRQDKTLDAHADKLTWLEHIRLGGGMHP